MDRWRAASLLAAGPLLLALVKTEPMPMRARGPLFTDVSARSGVDVVHVNGPEERKDYIFEAKGGGIGALDYDGDGWMDLVVVQGSTLERVRAGRSPSPVLYRNRGDFSFEDVSRSAGIVHRGWGMGVSAADYDNDGDADLYFTQLGPDVLYRNEGNGSFTDVTVRAGISAPGWSASAAFADFDGDGFVDLYVTSYLDVSPERLPDGAAGGTCSYRGRPVLCGPRGLPGARDLYYRNQGDGSFAEASEASGAADRERWFGLGVVASDLDGDGDQDIYVGNDATPNYLFVNRGDGRFDERGFASGVAVSGDGNEQASMGVDAADYDNDGRIDLYATHFANDYSTLYRNLGGMLFEDVTAAARVRLPEWPLVSWGTRFVDVDHDGWKDLVHTNGHVYPHLRDAEDGERYAQPALSLYRNLGDGTFEDAGREAGPDATQPIVGRGTAFADFDNDGDVDVAIARMGGRPLLLRNEGIPGRHWLTVRTAGRHANRDGIGTRITVRAAGITQTWEVKRTVGIYSCSDPRAHFGLGAATKADLVRVDWPGGRRQEFQDVEADRHYLVEEGSALAPEPLRGSARAPGR